jgi:hypothetical protein
LVLIPPPSCSITASTMKRKASARDWQRGYGRSGPGSVSAPQENRPGSRRRTLRRLPEASSDSSSPCALSGAKDRAEHKASLGARVNAHLAFANLGTRGVVRPSSRCGDRRRVLLWHELGCASGADGAVRRRLPIVSFVPASKRTALVVSWGSEHLADWPPGFRCARGAPLWRDSGLRTKEKTPPPDHPTGRSSEGAPTSLT